VLKKKLQGWMTIIVMSVLEDFRKQGINDFMFLPFVLKVASK